MEEEKNGNQMLDKVCGNMPMPRR